MAKFNLPKFEGSHQYFTNIGIPVLSNYESNFYLVKKVDFTKESIAGNIEWRSDGVYLKVNGNYQRGFFYKKSFDIVKYGYPKFHIVECKTILEQKSKGYFYEYLFSNDVTVDVIDRNTHHEYSDVLLNICNNCREQIENVTGEYIQTTQYFEKYLKENDLKNKQKQQMKQQESTDIFGRPFNWSEISRAYRETVNYTCEECGFGGSDLMTNMDKRFLETHHIVSYELTNTHQENLKCLCSLCHSYQDERHQENFSKEDAKQELISFVNKYKDVLIKKNNPYVNDFLRKMKSQKLVF